jgi:hypothetical protein
VIKSTGSPRTGNYIGAKIDEWFPQFAFNPPAGILSLTGTVSALRELARIGSGWPIDLRSGDFISGSGCFEVYSLGTS